VVQVALAASPFHCLEPLPSEWADGQELVVEQPNGAGAEAQVGQWANDLEAGASRLPAEEHARFRDALDRIERESKEAVGREVRRWRV
jgi:hypothetical protein